MREGPASPNADTAGGKIAKLAQDAFLGGRKGYFADPDGHLREVSWNTQSPRALSATSSAFSAFSASRGKSQSKNWLMPTAGHASVHAAATGVIFGLLAPSFTWLAGHIGP